MTQRKSKAWVIAVNMGYGHQRTAYPLSKLAFGGKVINANNYEGISESDRKIWEKAKGGYEFISAFTRTPIIGKIPFCWPGFLPSYCKTNTVWLRQHLCVFLFLWIVSQPFLTQPVQCIS